MVGDTGSEDPDSVGVGLVVEDGDGTDGGPGDADEPEAVGKPAITRKPSRE